MNIVVERFLLIVTIIALGVNFYFDDQAHKRDIDANKLTDASNIGMAFRIARLETRIDSLNAKTSKVAEATMYLDSCQAVKTSKSDRAERRGKFVGGLLRGLFPGI